MPVNAPSLLLSTPDSRRQVTPVGELTPADLNALYPGELPPDAYAWPFYDDDEIAAALSVLESGKVNQWTGGQVRRFEERFAAAWGMPHAVAVSNGTVALELAMRALGIGPGMEVIVTSRSFMASASAIVATGAQPIFTDIDEITLGMTAETVAPHIGPQTRAILVVHLYGWPVDMGPILELASRHGLFVIEDCAQSHGAAIDGKPAGSFGHAAAFSFCQDKIMSTGGEGGMVLLRDTEAYWRGWSYKDHGKNFAARTGGPLLGKTFRYVHESFGTNWRMTELQAAIGLRQLDKLELWRRARTRNAAEWRQQLADVACLSLPEPEPRFRHAYYRLAGLLDPQRMNLRGQSRAQVHTDILLAIAATGTPVNGGGCPEIYREAAFLPWQIQPRQVAQEMGERSLAFPVHPTLTPRVIGQYAARVRAALAPYQL
jgi:dTDP-4-amino-4,6-dideoxygalactose transaminase